MARKTGRQGRPARPVLADPVLADPVLADPVLADPVQRGRIQPRHVPGTGVRTRDGHAHLARAACGEGVEQARDLGRDARAHQYVVGSREHRAVDRGRGGQLDLLQVVDAHRAPVVLPGQVYLHEIARDRQLGPGRVRAQPQPGDGTERLASRDPARHEVTLQDAAGHAGQRKLRQRAPHVPLGVAELQPPGQHHVQRHPRHHAELPGGGHRAGQPPAGDGHAHPALDEHRPARRASRFPAHQRAAGW